jgi:hypothetical protein
MNQLFEKLLTARLARHEVLSHPEAFTVQEQASTVHVSGGSWAKGVAVKKEDSRAMAVPCCLIDIAVEQVLRRAQVPVLLYHPSRVPD